MELAIILWVVFILALSGVFLIYYGNYLKKNYYLHNIVIQKKIYETIVEEEEKEETTNCNEKTLEETAIDYAIEHTGIERCGIVELEAQIRAHELHDAFIEGSTFGYNMAIASACESAEVEVGGGKIICKELLVDEKFTHGFVVSVDAGSILSIKIKFPD